jgi:hypothetical protein
VIANWLADGMVVRMCPIPSFISQSFSTDLPVPGYFQKHSSVPPVDGHVNSCPCIPDIFLYVPNAYFFPLTSNYLPISVKRGMARSGISTSFLTVEQRGRYQFHCALLLDVALLKYLDDVGNLRSAPLL